MLRKPLQYGLVVSLLAVTVGCDSLNGLTGAKSVQGSPAPAGATATPNTMDATLLPAGSYTLTGEGLKVTLTFRPNIDYPFPNEGVKFKVNWDDPDSLEEEIEILGPVLAMSKSHVYKKLGKKTVRWAMLALQNNASTSKLINAQQLEVVLQEEATTAPTLAPTPVPTAAPTALPTPKVNPGDVRYTDSNRRKINITGFNSVMVKRVGSADPDAAAGDAQTGAAGFAFLPFPSLAVSTATGSGIVSGLIQLDLPAASGQYVVGLIKGGILVGLLNQQASGSYAISVNSNMDPDSDLIVDDNLGIGRINQ